MSSQSETGHATNVAHFQNLIEFVTGYSTAYNPSKTSLQLPQLITLHTDSQTALSKVIAFNTIFNTKVYERSIAFSNLRKLSTRLFNALQSTDASTATINDAKIFNRKMQGKRAAAIQVPLDPATPAPNTISVSQQSYNQLIQHFSALKEVLLSEPSYTPNEPDLKVATLQTQIADLTVKNTAVAAAYTGVSNSRIQRNDTLYISPNSLIKTADEVKKYVKSLYGATSPQYAQVRSVVFRKSGL